MTSTEIYDNKTSTFAHVSHFGALKTSSAIPVIKGNFPGSSLDTMVWDEIRVSGGSTTVTQGVGQLKTGTNSAGSVKLLSIQSGRFEAGQVTTYQSGVYAGVGVADNIRRWGVMDATEQNGLFFELNGTDFRVVARAGGNDTVADSSDFGIDKDFAPRNANNTYRIFYSAGRAIFCSAQSGNLRPLHAMVDGNFPLVEDLDLGLYYENTNSGNATDVEMRVRGASSSVLGDLSTFNEGGAKIVADFPTEVARNRIPGYELISKAGRNADIDAGVAEDIWAGGGTYTGFNADENENLAFVSASTADAGSLVDSGTATGGSRTTLIDSGATFATDSVAVGDILVNDTRGVHGTISAVTETQVTVYRMHGAGELPGRNSAGDTYRIVSTSGTGAALVRCSEILDEDYEPQTAVYAVMNGTTTVTVTVNAMRATQLDTVLAGSGGTAAGNITVNQATSTANVFIVMLAGFDKSMVGAFTIPAGKTGLVHATASIVRANGSAGSGTVTLRKRRRGEVFVSERTKEIQTGGAFELTDQGPVIVESETDIKMRSDDTSDANSIYGTNMEIYLVKAI